MRRVAALLVLAAALGGCAPLRDLLVVRGDYGSSSGLRGAVGVRF
ncbi:hypothetical protein STAQ_08410 [Allostella sp. ATCC 35155]|nr:hypothetical protein STAQ_08410 [Stella sp. ATCC 35155]